MPMPPSSSLSGVSCGGETCFAVGQYTNPKGITVTLVERPDASGWSVVPSPNAPGATQNGLGGVSCASATFCFAVGSSSTASSATKTLIERWNGSKWSVVPSPNPRPRCERPRERFVYEHDELLRGRQLRQRFEPQDAHRALERLEVVGRPEPEPRTQSTCQDQEQPPRKRVVRDRRRVASRWAPTRTTRRGPFLLPTETLVERWNGSAWSIVKSPNPGKDPQHLPWRLVSEHEHLLRGRRVLHVARRWRSVTVADRTLERHRVDTRRQHRSRSGEHQPVERHLVFEPDELLRGRQRRTRRSGRRSSRPWPARAGRTCRLRTPKTGRAATSRRSRVRADRVASRSATPASTPRSSTPSSSRTPEPVSVTFHHQSRKSGLWHRFRTSKRARTRTRAVAFASG